MSEQQLMLEGYVGEIVALESRARQLREGWVSSDYEVNDIEADLLEATARSLRVSLAGMIIRLAGNAQLPRFEMPVHCVSLEDLVTHNPIGF